MPSKEVSFTSDCARLAGTRAFSISSLYLRNILDQVYSSNMLSNVTDDDELSCEIPEDKSYPDCKNQVEVGVRKT